MVSVFLRYVQYPMRFSAIFPDSLVQNYQKLYSLYSYLIWIINITYFTFMFAAVKDFRGSTNAFFALVNDRSMLLVAGVKGFMIVSKNMEKILTELITYEEKILNSNNREFLEIYHKIANKSKIIQFGYVGSLYICYFAFIIPHFVGYFNVIALERATNSTMQVMYMYEWWLPIDISHRFTFLVVQSLYVLIGANVFCSGQILVLNLFLYIIFRLRVLKASLKTIDATNLRVVKRFMPIFIKEHVDVIRSCEFANKIVKNVMLIEFVLVSFQLSMMTFQAMMTDSSEVRYFSASHNFQLLVQLLVLYWYVEKIRVESVSVADVVYDLPWYEYDKSTATDVHIIMMRSQKALSLTLGPFGNMTLDIAVKIIKTSYTFITFMQQTL